MKVLLVTSDRERCGIREYSLMLIEALGRVAPGVQVDEWPDPNFNSLWQAEWQADVVHVNHQAALHSNWGAEQVDATQAAGWPVVVTQHDTFESVGIMRERGLPDFRGADAVVVHEEVEGLTFVQHQGLEMRPFRLGTRFLRQGVLPAAPPQQVQPKLLGTCGFPFDWKGHAEVAEAAGRAGWRCLLLAPGASIEQAEHWQALAQGRAEIIWDYLQREEVVRRLAGCAATACFQGGGGSGTSGSVRLMLAARRPLLAFRSRMLRDLERDPLLWCDGIGGAVEALRVLEDDALDATGLATEATAFVADRDSWDKLAAAYAAIYRSVARR